MQKLEQDAEVQRILPTKMYLGSWESFEGQLGLCRPWMLHLHVHGSPSVPAAPETDEAKQLPEMIFSDHQPVSYQTFADMLHSHNEKVRHLHNPADPVHILLLTVCHSFDAIDGILEKCTDVQIVIAAKEGNAAGDLPQAKLARFCQLFYQFLTTENTLHDAFVMAGGKELLFLSCRSKQLEQYTLLKLMGIDPPPPAQPKILCKPAPNPVPKEPGNTQFLANSYITAHFVAAGDDVLDLLAVEFSKIQKLFTYAPLPWGRLIHLLGLPPAANPVNACSKSRQHWRTLGRVLEGPCCGRALLLVWF